LFSNRCHADVGFQFGPTMRAVLCLLAIVALALAEIDSHHSVTKRLVTTHPPFGRPVACLQREALGSPRTAVAIQSCQVKFCNCIKGVVVTRSVNTSAAFASPGSLECTSPSTYGQAGNWDTSCATLLTCYPNYIACIGTAARGCVQPALEQCNESVFMQCNEGRVCKYGELPNSLGAGSVFAITIGCFLFVFLLLFCAATAIGRKNRKPMDEPL